MTTLLLFAAVLTLATGAAVYWANSHRFTNRIFAAFSLISAGWLYCVFMAMWTGSRNLHEPMSDPVPWLRAAAAFGAFFPGLLWLLMGSILSTEGQAKQTLWRSWPWFLIAAGLAILSTTHYFIPTDSTPENPKRGVGYLFYNIASGGLYLFIVVTAYRRMRVAKGIQRLEMQFLILNAALACLLAIILNGVAGYFDLRPLARLTPLIILVFYLLTAWAVTMHRIFDARQVFLSLSQRCGLITILALGLYGCWQLLGTFLPAPLDLLLSTILCSIFVFPLERLSRIWFRLDPAQTIAAIRASSTDLARSQPNPDKLVAEFEQLLRHEYSATSASLLFDNGEHYGGTDLEVPKTRPGLAALIKAGWATPESLQRQRPAPGLVDLRSFLVEHHLGVAVTAPRNSPEPTMILVLGVKTNQKPFTYPEVQQLQEIAEFMDNILARSRLTLQARQSEQLAVIGLVGASLAHEIRNPLVSIKTFAHLLPTRFGDPEFRQRFNLLIPAEVDRIDNLTQQLLDLAHPRSHQFERISLHTIVRETFDLMQNNAQAAQVELASRLAAQPDTIRADSGAIRQVIINLVINAIQALEHQDTPRRVELRTRSLANGGVVLEVADNGPGIPPEQRVRLFRPFASTKTKGIGLGLAICADILREHGATINVPETGQSGATFRIQFPCPPPSS